MLFRPKYNETFPSLKSMYETEKDAIKQFCKETGIQCVWENDVLEISNQPENWILQQSLIDGTVLLYHKNTKNIQLHHKTYYEEIDGYHLQPMFYISIIYTLCYIYLHRLCVLQEHIPFEELPTVMQEFIQYYEREKAKIPKETSRQKRHLMLKIRKQSEKKAAASSVQELLNSLEDNPSGVFKNMEV